MMIGMATEGPRGPNFKPFPTMIFVNPVLTYASLEMDEDWNDIASIDNMIVLVGK